MAVYNWLASYKEAVHHLELDHLVSRALWPVKPTHGYALYIMWF